MRLNNQAFIAYNMRLPEWMHPYYDATDAQLEEMYPRIYHLVYPRVSQYCDNIDRKYGHMYIPTPREFDDMVDYLQKDIDADIKENKSLGVDINQWQAGSRALRDLIAILLLREIADRRRRRRRRIDRPGWYW